MKRQLLVIDDDASVRGALIKILRAAGYEVVAAADGQEGMNRLDEGHFHLLILDLDLPKISGWDILDAVRARFSHLPVIVMSAFFDQCVPGALTGADALLEKPPDVARLLSVVAKLSSEPGEEQSRRRTQLLSATGPTLPMPSSMRRLQW